MNAQGLGLDIIAEFLRLLDRAGISAIVVAQDKQDKIGVYALEQEPGAVEALLSRGLAARRKKPVST